MEDAQPRAGAGEATVLPLDDALVEVRRLREQLAQLRGENAELSWQLAVLRARGGAAQRSLLLLSQPALLAAQGADERVHLAMVAQALVSSIADGCAIDVTAPEGASAFALADGKDPKYERELRERHQRGQLHFSRGAVLRLPLVAHGAELGTLTIWCEQGPGLEPAELALVHWLARHLSLLLDRQRLRAAVEESARASDGLLSMVSHELRTPLSTISMSVETSIRRIEGSADQLPKEWLLQRLEKAKKAVLRTDRLIHTFLGMSQICTSRLVPDVQDVDLSSLARGAVHTLSDELSWARCDCHLHASRPVRGRWDPVQLEIVLNNLLTNVIKYAPGSRVDVRVEGQADGVLLSVEDRGPGIAAEHRERLFQRYSRLPSPSRVNGFGLGLWITRHFVEANGGGIEVESAPGKGTIFRVRLPHEGPEAAAPASAVTSR